MAKFYNSRVKTGKLAGSVFSIRNGETIERAYQPIVANPNTPAQIEARAKLKLMSQLAAVMAPVIAIPRMGAVSSRNRFTQENYGKTSYASNQATIDLLQVSLTKSVVGLVPLNVTRAGESLKVSLFYGVPAGLSRMVYSVFVKQSDNTIRFLTSQVVDEPGADNTFDANITMDSASYDVIIYGYGVRDNTEAAKVTFGNMEVPSAADVAQLIVNRSLTESDVTLTETRAIESVHSA